MPVNFANPNIKHVFVLMLENRSYDHMLGFLNGDISHFFNNDITGKPHHATAGASMIMPCDPGHEFEDVMEQLCGKGAAKAYQNDGIYPPINNSGFVTNYQQLKKLKGPINEIMRCYNTAQQLPVMAALADNFAVCNRWFSSMPGPTWPNRFFVHAASSSGLDHSPNIFQITKWETISGFSFPNKTIYDRMDENKKKYRLYRGRPNPLVGALPCVSALKGIKLSDTRSFTKFGNDINGHYPYEYTFIEPNYGDFVLGHFSKGQSQHPMDDVRGGEALIKETYETLRNSPLWEKSMLIITYDEHGGFYDHVEPTVAVPPGDNPLKKFNKNGFKFDRYGVRVPAIVVSAYTEATTDGNTYDHASVLATLEAIFGMRPLTHRDEQANNVTHLASLPQPKQTPERLPDVADPIIFDMDRELKNLLPITDEGDESAESGNVPGFLHIVLKAEMEGPRAKSFAQSQELVETVKRIQTKAEARDYIEWRLPALLEESE